MRLQRKGTSNLTIRLQPNNQDVTLLPGNVVDVSEGQYQALKDLYGSSFIDVGSDATLQMVEKSFTSAQIKALYSSPQALVSAPGAGYAIAVENVIVALSYLTAAYATNTDLYVNYDGSTAGDGAGANTLANAIDTILKATSSTICANRPQVDEVNLVQNKGITLYVGTGNPATGAGTIKVRVYYRIVAL